MKVQVGPGHYNPIKELVLKSMLSGVTPRPRSLGVTAKELLALQQELRAEGLYSPELAFKYQAAMKQPSEREEEYVPFRPEQFD